MHAMMLVETLAHSLNPFLTLKHLEMPLPSVTALYKDAVLLWAMLAVSCHHAGLA